MHRLDRRAPRRRGFSFFELLVVMVIIGIAASIGMMKIGDFRRTSNVQTAKQEIAAALRLARATAVRRGIPVTFNSASDGIWVTAARDLNESVQDTLQRKIMLTNKTGVTVTRTTNMQTVRFDSRGMANLTGSTGKIWVTLGTRTDSICVTKIGVIMRKGCL